MQKMLPVEIPRDGISNDFLKYLAGDWRNTYVTIFAGLLASPMPIVRDWE